MERNSIYINKIFILNYEIFYDFEIENKGF